MRKFFAVLFVCALMLPFALADEQQDKILEPINKIYELMKLAVSVVGAIAITAAGAMYMFSGGNIVTRENAKSMATYAVIGLVLVWVAPLIVNYLTSPSGA